MKSQLFGFVVLVTDLWFLIGIGWVGGKAYWLGEAASVATSAGDLRVLGAWLAFVTMLVLNIILALMVVSRRPEQ